MSVILIQSLAALIFSGGVAVAGTPQVQSQPAPARVSICIPHFREEFLTLAVMTARDHGFFAKNNLQVDLVPIGAGLRPDPLNDFNVAQTVSTSATTCQFGASNVERFLTRDDGAQLGTVPLLLSSYGQEYDTHLVVSANSKIKNIADLKGKVIRMGQTPVRIAMEGILAEAGLKLTDIKQDYFTPSTEVLAQLESGKIDAAVTYVPTMPYMLASGKVRVLKSNIVKAYLGDSVPHSLVIANRHFALEQPTLVKHFILAITQATDYIRRNPTEAIYALQRNTSSMGHAAWKVDKVTVEKAGEFIGKINTVDLFNSSPNRVTAQTQLRNYGILLQTHGIVAQPADVAHWLGLTRNN